jgi:hypothetical protein
VSVVRGIALRRPIALAGLPDDVIVGDPSGFHVRAVEKDTQPLSTFANDSAHVGSLELVRLLMQHNASWRRDGHHSSQTERATIRSATIDAIASAAWPLAHLHN